LLDHAGGVGVGDGGGPDSAGEFGSELIRTNGPRAVEFNQCGEEVPLQASDVGDAAAVLFGGEVGQDWAHEVVGFRGESACVDLRRLERAEVLVGHEVAVFPSY